MKETNSYRICAEIRVYLDARISGKTETDAARKFENYIRGGNYDRQINRELNKQGNRQVEILTVQPIWRD